MMKRIQRSYIPETFSPESEQFFYEFHLECRADIIDGDTLDINIDAGFGITKRERIRLFGIDAPEISTSFGREVHQKVQKLLWPVSGKTFYIRTQKKRVRKKKNIVTFSDLSKKGKYGRYLGEIFVKNAKGRCWNLNKTLLKNNMAKSYFGGKR